MVHILILETLLIILSFRSLKSVNRALNYNGLKFTNINVLMNINVAVHSNPGNEGLNRLFRKIHQLFLELETPFDDM